MTGKSNNNMEQIMTRILEIRYSDLEEELRLCRELLAWSVQHHDSYKKAFAFTYMGDYYIALYDGENAGKCLLKAQSLLEEGQDWDELRLRVYSLLGICYDMSTDEQNAIEYYLKAVAVAEMLGDVEVQCAVLNNLALAFQRHQCYEAAADYYLKAYELQAPLKESPIRSALLSNLAEICLVMHKYEDAQKYIKECEEAEKDPYERAIASYKNWCGYFSAVEDKERALKYAELLLQNQNGINQNKLLAFETYHTLCSSMIHLKEKGYAARFMQAMEEMGASGALDQVQAIEDTKMAYTLLFEPSKKHAQAYRRFCESHQKIRTRINETIVNAMKSKIHLEQLMQQTQQIQSEREILQREVNLDELTNIHNRRFLEILMRERAQRSLNKIFGIVIVDVDFFKEYNDFYGHIKGDLVLKQIANCLLMCRVEQICPCRYGGDEFVCVCDGLSEEKIEAYIQRVREQLHKKKLPHEKSFCSDEVTLSIGYAITDNKTPMEPYLLFQIADQALYESKHSGRNTYTKKELMKYEQNKSRGQNNFI